MKPLTERMIWRNEGGTFVGRSDKNFGALGNVRITVHQAGDSITVEMQNSTFPVLSKSSQAATDLTDAERIITAYIDAVNTLRREIPTEVYYKARKAFNEILNTALDKRLHPEKYQSPLTTFPTIADVLKRHTEQEDNHECNTHHPADPPAP